jgi:hypothetical protein
MIFLIFIRPTGPPRPGRVSYAAYNTSAFVCNFYQLKRYGGKNASSGSALANLTVAGGPGRLLRTNAETKLLASLAVGC